MKRDQEVQNLALTLVLAVAGLAVAGFAILAMYLLADELYSTVVAVICALLMLVPCISLIVMVIVNQKATMFLQSRGVKVGFLGTSPDKI